jgi:hypothetical protein
MQFDAVSGRKEDVLVIQPEIRGGAGEIGVGEKDDTLFGILQNHCGPVFLTRAFAESFFLTDLPHSCSCWSF